MSNDWVAFIGFVSLFVLMMLRVPVGMAMGLVGVTGYSYIVGPGPALKLVGQTSLRTVTDYTFGVIPMFMLMGAFVTASGLSREMFKAADAFLGHLRGGLGIATVVACGGFAAICGSSVATAATVAAVAYPEMRRSPSTARWCSSPPTTRAAAPGDRRRCRDRHTRARSPKDPALPPHPPRIAPSATAATSPARTVAAGSRSRGRSVEICACRRSSSRMANFSRAMTR